MDRNVLLQTAHEQQRTRKEDAHTLCHNESSRIIINVIMKSRWESWLSEWRVGDVRYGSSLMAEMMTIFVFFWVFKSLSFAGEEA